MLNKKTNIPLPSERVSGLHPMASISCGFIQAPTKLMGFIGWARSPDSQGAPKEFGTDVIVPGQTPQAPRTTARSYRAAIDASRFSFPAIDDILQDQGLRVQLMHPSL
jgi:hypothetical protein